MKPTLPSRLAFVGIASLGLASHAGAQTTYTKADNTTSLNFASSYTANSGVPGATDSILIDNTLSANRTAAIGGNLTVKGISMTAAPISAVSRQFQFNGTTGAVLTIGVDGVTKAANTSALIFANALTLGANQTWTINAVSGTGTGNLQLNGAFSDGGYTLNVNGGGIFDLRGSNTFGSNVTIDAAVSINSASAVVTLGGANTFNSLAVPSGRVIGSTIGNFGQASNFGDGGTNTAITLGNTTNGILEYAGTTTTTNRTVNRDARSTASGIEVSTAGQTLTISGNLGSGTQVNAGNNGWVFGGAGNLTLNGVVSNASGVGSTGTTVTKSGSGTLVLGNTNTYSGITQVNGGTMIVGNGVSGSAANSAFTVNDTGSLKGSGTVGALTVASGGTVAPGTSTGILSAGNTALQTGSTLGVEIAGGTVGTGYDQLNVTGSVSLAGMLSISMAYTPAVNSLFFILANDGTDTISGTFSNAPVNGSTYTLGGQSFQISYFGDTSTNSFTGGNDVVLKAIPEPGAALLGGLGMLALLRRRR